MLTASMLTVMMLILLHLDPADILGAKAYRLQVKERLYRFNYVRPFLHPSSFDLVTTTLSAGGTNTAGG